MAIRNLSHLIALLPLRGEIIHTLDQVKAHPLTQNHVSAFEGLRDAWSSVFAEELTLRDRLSAANARVFACDLALNDLASRVSKSLLTLTGDDRTHPLYVAYFKKKSLSEFKRPMLGKQLEATKGWVPELMKSDIPALVALAAEVEAAVNAADAALNARTTVEAEATFFRETGNRKKLFDKVNAVRKQTYGELAKMPHENMGLPPSFANLFFRHESSNAEDDRMTPETIKQEIASLEAQTAEKKELLAALVAELEKQAKAEAEKAAEQAAIAELEKLAMEAAQKLAQAKAKLVSVSA
ncbi:MAG TPA: hypothetical protein VE093_00060 [Polyangiaceae bacterium]|jgi:hypothetical protein|nr:hypothetical protein [Polyangiaceae bacterium]